MVVEDVVVGCCYDFLLGCCCCLLFVFGRCWLSLLFSFVVGVTCPCKASVRPQDLRQSGNAGENAADSPGRTPPRESWGVLEICCKFSLSAAVVAVVIAVATAIVADMFGLITVAVVAVVGQGGNIC